MKRDNMNHSVRILLVLPMYGGSLPVGRYCASALKRLGHLVEVFEAPDFYPAFTALKSLKVTSDRLERLENSFLQVVSQAVAAKAETFEPDLVLSMAQAPLSRQVLKRFRNDGVPTAMWFVEDFRLFTYWRAFAPYYDLFAVIQKDPFGEELAKIGQENVIYLPLAADPEFHRPLDLSSVDRRRFGSDVSFLGAGYPNRRKAFRELTGYDFKIWGTEWDDDAVLAAHLQMGGARIAPDDAVKIFNASKINLNLHSSVSPDEFVSRGDFVNPRTFEVAACGAFQLADRRGLMPELFSPDELATFESLDELKELIDAYLADEDARREVAARARARVLRDHTYDRRMQDLLDFAAQRRPGWPEGRRADEALAGMPPDFQADLALLLKDLGLPRDAAFNDLVWAVRSRRGVLSELETAVLFLDEWRKQYAPRA